MDSSMDGWINRWIDRQMDGLNKRKERWMADRSMDVWMDGSIDSLMAI